MKNVIFYPVVNKLGLTISENFFFWNFIFNIIILSLIFWESLLRKQVYIWLQNRETKWLKGPRFLSHLRIPWQLTFHT